MPRLLPSLNLLYSNPAKPKAPLKKDPNTPLKEPVIITLLYSTLLSSSLLYYIILCHTIPYSTLLYSTLLYHTIPYHTIPYHTIPYNTIPYHTIPYHTIPYHAILSYPILFYPSPPSRKREAQAGCAVFESRYQDPRGRTLPGLL